MRRDKWTDELCDFCACKLSDAHTVYAFDVMSHVRDEVDRHVIVVQEGRWAACELCADDISIGRLDRVAHRAASQYRGVYPSIDFTLVENIATRSIACTIQYRRAGPPVVWTPELASEYQQREGYSKYDDRRN